MVAGVVAVAGLRREIDAADEGDPVVNDDRLLVVAVHRTLVRVECDLRLRMVDQGGRASRARRRERAGTVGSGAPAQAITRTGTRSAISARRSRRTSGSPSRTRAKDGVKNHPVRCT